MRLVQLAAYDGPYPGSSVPMIHAALSEGRRRGWQVEAVFAETARERPWLSLFADDNIPVRIVERAARGTLARELEALLAERPAEPTILHTHFTVYDVPAVLAARRRAGTAVFWHLHTPPEPRLSIRVRNRLKFSLFARGAAAILCVAPQIAEQVARMGAGNRARFFPNGIETREFHRASPEEQQRARRELGSPPAEVLLGHLAWDWEVKGGDILLEALRRLRDMGLDVGAITRAGQPDLARADRERLGLGEAVTILERLERAQSMYDAVDVFVSSSRKEGMPFAVLEALLSGRPVLASDIPGHALVAADYPGCRIVPADPAGMAEGLRALLEEDPAPLRAEVDRGATLIAERMSIGAWTSRLFDLYAQFLPASER